VVNEIKKNNLKTTKKFFYVLLLITIFILLNVKVNFSTATLACVLIVSLYINNKKNNIIQKLEALLNIKDECINDLKNSIINFSSKCKCGHNFTVSAQPETEVKIKCSYCKKDIWIIFNSSSASIKSIRKKRSNRKKESKSSSSENYSYSNNYSYSGYNSSSSNNSEQEQKSSSTNSEQKQQEQKTSSNNSQQKQQEQKSTSNNSEQKQQDQKTRAENETRKKQYRFKCSCGKTLNFSGIPKSKVRITCTGCRSVYEFKLFEKTCTGKKESGRKYKKHTKTPKMSKIKAASILDIVIDNITPKIIKNAYRKKIKEFHPDKFSRFDEYAVKAAEQETVKINEAYYYMKNLYQF
jgi:hypothetical protein